MQTYIKILAKLKNKSADETSLSHVLWIVIVFVIGGLILAGLIKAFNIDILPSLTETFKNIITF